MGKELLLAIEGFGSRIVFRGVRVIGLQPLLSNLPVRVKSKSLHLGLHQLLLVFRILRNVLFANEKGDSTFSASVNLGMMSVKTPVPIVVGP